MPALQKAWTPSPQDLTLKATFPSQQNQNPTCCSNIRYTFAGCLHILLLRCTIHPVSQETCEYGTYHDSSNAFFNTCPDPRATFSAVEAVGSCPVCAGQAGTRLKMLEIESRIGDLEQEIKLCRASRGGNSLSFSSLRGDVLKAELQRAKEALAGLVRGFDPCGGGPGLDVLGLRESYDPARAGRVQEPCWWDDCEGEDAKLWAWGMEGGSA